MRYVVNDYAVVRLAQRGVSRAMTDLVMQRPDQVVAGNEPGRSVYQSKVAVRGKLFLLRIVVDEHRDPLRVVTLYLTNQIARYWVDPEEDDEP
jgi:hypothetical protein